MILSNITVPLLGLVDAGVIGHLEHSWYLGGVAVGGTMINILLWLFGFLRMATTGITAQAFGADDKDKQSNIFIQSIIIASIFSISLLILGPIIASLVLSFSCASNEVKFYATQYFNIRLYSAPAALANLVIMGWLLGKQQAKYPMTMLVITNITNIILDIIFVVYFSWQVEGAAIASVIADYIGLVLGIWFVILRWKQAKLPALKQQINKVFHNISAVFKLNADIFIRSLCLQMAFSFMTFYGAKLGDHIAAANAILIGFLMLISYAMDGLAYAMEALVGQSIGAKNKSLLKQTLFNITFWGLIVSLILTLIFILFGHQIIDQMSSIQKVHNTALIYLPWLAVFPLIAMWCFLLDGVFVGATRGHDLRNSAMYGLICFFITWWLTNDYGNHTLWAAMLIFMAVRGIILAQRLYIILR